MSRQITSLNQRKSRYTQGGVTDNLDTRLGWWERKKINKHPSDMFLEVAKRSEGRADLIAYQIYGDVNLSWLVLQFNAISDPVTEIVKGTVLRLPTPSRVQLTILTRSLR